MSVPVAPFSRLSLDEMSPTSQSGPHTALQGDTYEPTVEDSSSDLESYSDSEDDDDELSMVVQSPTKLAYNINHLPEKAQGAVRETFSEPPAIALQQCRLIDDTYAFQMTELVTQSIRIRANGDGSSQLTCSCGRGDDAEPCSHLLWLLDRLTKQMLYDYDPKTPLTMTQDGFAEELGDPFTAISEHHLDVLSDGLHCQVIDPEALSEDDLASYRVQESRELLSAVYGKTPEDFRPDIFARPVLGKKVLKRNDLDCTVFRMLLDNHHFFNYFQSVSRPRDPINDPFRKLAQRVDRVLRRFDAYASDPSPARSSAETLPNVAWAAKHLLGCVKLIKSIIYTRDRPLQPSEASSAVRTLVHILSAVASRNHDVVSSGSPTPRIERNLYLRLIGDRDRDFVLAELNLLPEAASQHLHTLEAVLEDVGMHGAPVTFVDKFKALLSRLRAPKRSSSLKRQGDDGGDSSRGSKRMK
ncbi:SWIM-type domain-containing protein [Trichoderma simmonsii]|uniref:SWIM-type domain-containing protein n=1 Tax=Trichoderma simmonsii TaxID=1491479 RepID=A0A8G0LHP5_9HYPO|nr:hypothetical protein Trihar35433_6085 [Trichoderma harzianum]QYT00990.1 SWIM-type domain-containing protein [Trichoderma simmonsii]